MADGIVDGDAKMPDGRAGSCGPECVLRCCLRFLPIAFSTKATFICPNGPSSPPSSPAALIPATAPPFHIATALLYCCHYVASVIAPIEPNYTTTDSIYAIITVRSLLPMGSIFQARVHSQVQHGICKLDVAEDGIGHGSL